MIGLECEKGSFQKLPCTYGAGSWMYPLELWTGWGRICMSPACRWYQSHRKAEKGGEG